MAARSETSAFSINSPVAAAVANALSSPGSQGSLAPLDPDVVPDFARANEASILALYREHPDAASVVDEHGRLPIHHAVAVQRPSLEVVKLLLEKNRAGARVKDAYGNTPLHVLVAQRVAKVWRLAPRAFGIKRAGAANMALAATPLVPRTVIKKLLSTYPDAALVRNAQGLVPVRLALSRAAPAETIDELLTMQPMCASVADPDGSFLLHFAATCKPRVTTWLRVLKAHPRAASRRDCNGFLPVHLALAHELPLTHISPLLEAFPDGAVTPDQKGQTLLHFAADLGSPANVIAKIIEYNTRATSTVDHVGNTPLHYACSSSKATEEVVSMLLHHRPDAATRKNNAGFSPLHLAYMPRIAYLLLHRIYSDATPSRSAASSSLLAEDRALVARVSQYAGFACWHGMASCVLEDTQRRVATEDSDLEHHPRTDRVAVASALYVAWRSVAWCVCARSVSDCMCAPHSACLLAPTRFALAPSPPPNEDSIVGGAGNVSAGESKGSVAEGLAGAEQRVVPANIPDLPVLTFSELARMAGSPPDVSHWTPTLMCHWFIARGWLQSEEQFARGVGGPQVCAWLDQDSADGLGSNGQDGTAVLNGLQTCGLNNADAHKAVAEIKRVFAVRNEFETQVRGPAACACGVVV